MIVNVPVNLNHKEQKMCILYTCNKYYKIFIYNIIIVIQLILSNSHNFEPEVA